MIYEKNMFHAFSSYVICFHGRHCIGGGVGGAYALVESMKKGGKLTLNRVVSTFGVSTATSYVACLIENGIKK